MEMILSMKVQILNNINESYERNYLRTPDTKLAKLRLKECNNLAKELSRDLGRSVKVIYDAVQNFRILGIKESDIDKYKSKLKEYYGAVYFRTTKSSKKLPNNESGQFNTDPRFDLYFFIDAVKLNK